MTIYLVALAALMAGAIAGSFAAPESLFGCLRFIPIFAVYSLFLVMAATEGVLTSLVAAFVRQYWSRCPALA